MASEAFPRSQELSQKLNKQTKKKKKNSKGAFNLERSALPTKDCKSWARSCGAGPGAGTATKPGARPAGPRSAQAHVVAARGGSRLSSEKKREKCGQGPGQTEGLRFPPARASGGGSSGRWKGMRPQPCQRAALLSRRGAGSCLGRICHRAVSPYPGPDRPDGSAGEETDGFSSSYLFLSPSEARGASVSNGKGGGMADGARGQSPRSARPHLPARRY